MILPRLALAAVLAAGLSTSALAQWWLPGGRSNEPPVPPAPVPGAPAPAQPAPGAPLPLGQGPGQGPGQGVPGAPQAAPVPPPQPRPAAVRFATEEDVVGRDLRRNGTAGRLRIERLRGALAARVTLEGTMISRPGQACEIRIADGEPVPLKADGRPEGSLRFALEASACPLAFDVLEGAVLVPASAAACTFQAADCRAEVRGLWGPEPGGLVPQARAIESARGDADKQVRDNYRVLTQRAQPHQARAIVSEQAAFTSERDMTCRDYAREAAHGFCNARFTSARAASLAGRLGLATATPAPAPRRRETPPATTAAPRQAPQTAEQPF